MTPESCLRRLRIFADLESLSHAAADAVVELVQRTVAERGQCFLALAGGSTPRWLYELLATRHREYIPWTETHWFFGDERYLPPDDPRTNYHMLKEALLDRLHVPLPHVHPMPTGFTDPREAAAAYEATMREDFAGPWPRFDLVLLGLGEDGHTASLFPETSVLTEDRHWVAPSIAPTEPRRRLTMTYPVINHAARVFFLVSGVAKARPLRLALRDDADPMTAPAAGVRPVDGELVWWVDEAATLEVRYPPAEEQL